jgi:hypothetical protein
MGKAGIPVNANETVAWDDKQVRSLRELLFNDNRAIERWPGA